MTILDCAVVGAGPAGIAASLRLHARGVQAMALVEARTRIGGRVLTLLGPDAPPLDAGAQWLHAADRNPLVEVIEAAGLTVRRHTPPWGVHAVAPVLPAAERPAVATALAAAEADLAAIAIDAPDRPLARALPAAGDWGELQALFWTLMAGDEPERVSAQDHAAFHDTGCDWQVEGGLGSAFEALASPLQDVLVTGNALRAVDWHREVIRLQLTHGTIEARRVILALPIGVLADGAVRFRPELPAGHREALAGIAPGAAEKAWLGLGGDAIGLAEGTAMVTRTDSREAAFLLVLSREPLWVQGLVAGECARTLAREPGAVAAFLAEECVRLFGSRVGRDIRVRRETQWQRDPFTRGAYSHVPPGGMGLRSALAGAADGRLWFAGEACSRHAAGAVHGAWASGEAAADAVLASLGKC